ncbi:F-box/LRR-repeat protein 12-like [Amphibalanus amphitrite]|uniref:F-box/LRR-repeat protein 12-like n=1 Tax=Amphibalanus amphitrite TaxID=1232801 RepID=UPI001C9285A8|nr:F-box/LRR-repeat protein 12-like [Amphibalanus amphitrite]
MSPEPSLVDLPDELLLQVMSHLTTSDILLLARTCRRLCGLLSDRSLWYEVDLRQSRLRARQLARLLRHLHNETRRVCVAGHVERGRPVRPPLLTARILTDIKARCESSLVDLRLERCLLNATELPLELLPKSLLYLSLRGSEVTHRPAGRSYFSRLWEFAPRLTELDLSECGWIDSHALLPLSKLASLQRLSLRHCRRLGGEIAYSSISCMLGFRELRALDVRRTQVADCDVSGFCQLPRLTELLLEPRRHGYLDGDTAISSLGAHCGAQLRRLALRRTRLREQSVERLPQLLPNLEQLDLTGCGVSSERLGWLADQLPGCAVSCHESKPDPESGPGAVASRRRRRSPSPSADADGPPAAKRRRLQRCQCAGCEDGEMEDGEDSPQEDEEHEEDTLDEELENQPGVIVVNLFDGRWRINGAQANAENAVGGGREAGNGEAGGKEP